MKSWRSNFIILQLLILHALNLGAFNLEELSLNITNTWHDFGKYKTCKDKVFEKHALKKLITFRSKKAHKLTSLKLKWTGSPLQKITSSLYRKKEKETLLLIEKNVVSDGIWNPKKQEVTFPLNEKIYALNKYYLVVSFSDQLEKKVKQGKFVVVSAR